MNPKSKRYKNIIYEEIQEGSPLTIKEVQNVLLEMMKALHDFCVKHNITYCLASGSLLGAVRHKGFIPWDDDIDVYMPRPDYERFIQYQQISEQYEIVTFKDDHGYYHPFAYCALTDKNTIMIEKDMRCPTGKGQFLDIFPLDGVCDDEKLRKKQYKKLKRYGLMKGVQSINYKHFKINSLKDVIKKVCALLLTPVDEMKIVQKQDCLAQKYKFGEVAQFSQLICGEARKRCYTKKYFEKLILVPFEKYEFYITADYDAALKLEYGDYMKLPPVEQRYGKHRIDLYKRRVKK